MNNTATNPLRFTQTGLDTWKAFDANTGETAARITELVDGESYRIVYIRCPGDNPRNPAKTTRTIKGDLDKAQKLIIRRGWR